MNQDIMNQDTMNWTIMLLLFTIIFIVLSRDYTL